MSLSKAGTKWTDDERETLRRIWPDRTISPDAIEAMMQRTWQACNDMARHLGMPERGSRGRRPAEVTAEMIALIRANREAGLPFSVSAQALGRGRQWVINRAIEHGFYTTIPKADAQPRASAMTYCTPERAEAGWMPLPPMHPLAVREIRL